MAWYGCRHRPTRGDRVCVSTTGVKADICHWSTFHWQWVSPICHSYFLPQRFLFDLVLDSIWFWFGSCLIFRYKCNQVFVLPTPHFFVRLQSLSERQGLKIHYNYPRTIMHRLQLCRCPTCCVISVVKEVSFCSIIRAQMLQTVRPVLRTICGGKNRP